MITTKKTIDECEAQLTQNLKDFPTDSTHYTLACIYNEIKELKARLAAGGL